MEAQSQTITGQISNIEDSIEQMFNELGKKSEGVITSVLDVTSKIVDNWESIGKALLVVISAYGAYKAAVVTIAAINKVQAIWGEVQAFLSLTKSVTSAKDAMLLLNLATKANPIGLVLGVVAAAASAFALFSDNTGKAAEMTQKYGEKAASAIVKVETLTSMMRGLTAGSSSYKKAMEELNGILEDYGLKQLTEKDGLSPKTARDILTVLKSVLIYAGKQFPGQFPAVEIVFPREIRREARVHLHALILAAGRQILFNECIDEIFRFDGFAFFFHESRLFSCEIRLNYYTGTAPVSQSINANSPRVL